MDFVEDLLKNSSVVLPNRVPTILKCFQFIIEDEYCYLSFLISEKTMRYSCVVCYLSLSIC